MMLSGLSILLAEDNPTNQMVATYMLESLGAEVTLARDGAEALEILEARAFDVALIDIEMPRVSGLEVMRRLRAQSELVPPMPLIALTAYVVNQHRAEIEDAGADGIIAKPIVSIDAFGNEVLALVRQHRARQPDHAAPVDGGVDRRALEEFCASFRPRTRAEGVSRVISDVASGCEAIAVAVRARDFAELNRATHPMISVAGTIGAARLEALALRLSSAAQAGEEADLDDVAWDILTEAERILRMLCREKQEAAA